MTSFESFFRVGQIKNKFVLKTILLHLSHWNFATGLSVLLMGLFVWHMLLRTNPSPCKQGRQVHWSEGLLPCEARWVGGDMFFCTAYLLEDKKKTSLLIC